MNKITTILSATVLLGSVAQAQTYLVNEDFEGTGLPAGFTQWIQGGGVSLNPDQAAPAFRPTGVPTTGNASSGQVLQIDLPGDGNNGGFYVTVSLEAGKFYEVDAATRSMDDPTSHWEEIFISTVEPVQGVDVVPDANATLIGKNSSWAGEDWDNTLQTSNDFGGLRVYTAPSTGTFYVVYKTGVCCAGGPATTMLDEFTIQEAAPPPTYDTPPTPLMDDFEAAELRNNYGGIYNFFAGGDPGGVFTLQDASMSLNILDGVGTGGSRALHLKSDPDLEGANFIYYGAVANLHPNAGTPVDLSGFNSLTFDARLGDSANPINYWNVRFEDTTNAPTNNLWNFVRIGENPFVGDPAFPSEVPNPMPLTTSWQTFTFPLSAWDDANATGGLSAPDLANAKALVFVSEDGANPYLPPTLNVDLLIDNIVISTDSNVADWQLF